MTAPEPIVVTPTTGDIVDSHMDMGKLVTTVGLCLVMGIIVYLMLRSDKRAEEDHKRSKEFFDSLRGQRDSTLNGHRAGSYDFAPPKAPSDAQTDQM